MHVHACNGLLLSGFGNDLDDDDIDFDNPPTPEDLPGCMDKVIGLNLYSKHWST